MGVGGGREEQEGVVREGSMKGMALSKHGGHLVKRKWLPGRHISLNTSNRMEIEKAYQRKPHIWASLAGAEVSMRCAGDLLKLVVLSWWGMGEGMSLVSDPHLPQRKWSILRTWR